MSRAIRRRSHWTMAADAFTVAGLAAIVPMVAGLLAAVAVGPSAEGAAWLHFAVESGAVSVTLGALAHLSQAIHRRTQP